MPCFGKISLSNSFLSQNRMGKGVQEVYFSSNIPTSKNLGTVVAPQGDHGASECEAGVGTWGLTASLPRAPLDPRASLIVCAPFALRAS